jgi:light-regulated signal transduction histidine kinase (bacteriophytochrome)
MSEPIPLDSFVSMLSHDLRSSLAFIIGYADLLLEGYCDPLTESQAEQVRHLRENAERAANLIVLLSDVFKLTHGQLTLEFTLTDIPHLLSQAADNITTLLTSRHQTIEIVNESAFRFAMVDGDRLQKALTLLLRRAAQQGPAHSIFRLHIADHPEGGDTLVVTGHILTSGPIKSTPPSEQSPSAYPPIPVFIAQSLLQAHGGQLSWSDCNTDGEFLRMEIPRRREMLSS